MINLKSKIKSLFLFLLSLILFLSSFSSSYFYGSYIILDNEGSYIIKCFYDTHNTATNIEFFNETAMECGFEFELSSDKQTLSAITDFSNFSFDELIF